MPSDDSNDIENIPVPEPLLGLSGQGAGSPEEAEIVSADLMLESIADEEIEELDDFELIDEEDSAEVVHTPPPPLPKSPPARLPMSAATALTETLITPDPVSVLDDLIAESESADWHSRVVQLQEQLAAAISPEEIGELAYELGELQQREIGDQSAAVQAYGKSLKADPSLRANLWAIRRVFYARKLWPNLVKLITAELRSVKDANQRADNLVERGVILLHQMGEFEQARESFEEALVHRNDDLSALMALERIARKTGDQACLWRVMRSMADASGSPQRKASLLIDLAREYRLSRSNWEEAQELLSEAFALDVMHEAVFREREALALAMDDSSAWVMSLEQRIARLATRASDEESDTARESRLRRMVAMRRHQARLQMEADELEGAWGYLQEGLILAPGDTLLLADLAQIAERLGRFDELAELAEARESGETDTRKALGLALQRSAALAKAGKNKEAEELLQARSLSMPGFLPLVVAREVHAAARGDWQELARLQAELAQAVLSGVCFGEATSEEVEPSASLEAAEHYVVAGDYSQYGDPVAVIGYYQQALKLCPVHRSASFALSAAFVRRQQFKDAAEALAPLAEGADADPVALESLADLHFLDGASAEERMAIEALYKLQPERQDLQGRILSLAREMGDSEKVAEAALQFAQTANDPDVQARYYFESGYRNYSDLEKFQDAATCFQQCLELWPDDVVVAELYISALRKHGDWEMLASALQELTEAWTGDQGRDWGRYALSILEDELKDSKKACTWAVALFERFPDDIGVSLDACACLAIAEAAGDTQYRSSLIDIVEILVGQSEGVLETSLQLWLAILNAKEERSAEAQRWASDASKGRLLPALLLRYELALVDGDTDAQSEMLSEIAASLESDEDQASILEQAGWQFLVTQQDEAALECFSQSLASSDGRVGSRLGRSLALAMGRAGAEEQRQAIEELSALCTSPYAQGALLLRAAMMAEVSGDPEAAADYLERSQRVSGEDSELLVALGDRVGPVPADGSASEAGLQNSAFLSEGCADISTLEDSGWDWKLSRGEALERLGKLPEAKNIALAAIARSGMPLRSLRLLQTVCTRGGDAEGAAACAVSIAGKLANADSKKFFLRQAAAFYDGEEQNTQEAVACYCAILKLDGGAEEYSRLVEILEKHSDPNTLFHVYSRRLQYLLSEDEVSARIPILLARSLLRESLGDIAGATGDANSVLRIDKAHIDALEVTKRLQEKLKSQGGQNHVR